LFACVGARARVGSGDDDSSGRPTMAPKAVGGGPATLQQKSPAEFFAENKNIAGFDNVE
jgi:hypothetical protein